MARPSILFLPFHGLGHYNGLFGVARALQKTHDVVFVGTGYFHNHVVSRGFTFRILASFPFGLGLEGWIHETVKRSKHPLLHNIADRWSDRLYNERKTELTKVLGEFKPVHVLVDAQQATDVIVLKSIDPSIRVSIVNTAIPYLLIPGLPPANSLAMPGDDDSALEDSLKKIRAKAWRQRLKYFGLDDRTMVDRRLRRNGMMSLKDVYPSLLTFAAKGVEQYVLTYREFDFQHKHFESYRYVGPHVDEGFIEPNTEKYLNICRSVKARGKKLVYCSFGTVAEARRISPFIVQLKKAMTDFDCEFIIATNLEWIPQKIVLSFADVFITHGGLNSIHEAIRYKVPMIVYPIDENYDQKGNSSRVIHHGFGLRGDFDSATAGKIRQKLNEIFTDIRFKKNLEDFDTSSYPVDNFIQMLLS